MNDAHIGIQLADGSFYEILAAGDQQTRELILEPANPGQQTIRIRLVEGAEGRVIRSLGTVALDDVTTDGAGIRLTVSRDPDGQVVATAEDVDSGNSQSFTVNPEDPAEMDFSEAEEDDFGEVSFDDLEDGAVMPLAGEEDEVSLDDLSFSDSEFDGPETGSLPSTPAPDAEADAAGDSDPDLDDLEFGDFSFESGGPESPDSSPPADGLLDETPDPVAASGADVAEIDLSDEFDDDLGGLDLGDAEPDESDLGLADDFDVDFEPPASATQDSPTAPMAAGGHGDDFGDDLGSDADSLEDDSLDFGDDFDLPGEADGTIEGAGDRDFAADLGPGSGEEENDDFSADYSFDPPDATDRFGAAVTAGLVLVSLSGIGGLTFLVFRLLQSAPIPSLTG